MLEANQNSALKWQAFINALTTNLTAFREAHHFPILADLCASPPRWQYRVWSAAASTGEEHTNIAITLADDALKLVADIRQRY